MGVNRDECVAAGFDEISGSEYEIYLLSKRLERAAKVARRLGVELFAGSGSMTIRSTDDLILASVEGPRLWDGGDGGYTTDQTGLLRGERSTS